MAFDKDLDEIRAIKKTGDTEFNSYLFEREQYNILLDSYASSLNFVDENLDPVNRGISDQASQEALGIHGAIHYRQLHAQTFDNLCRSMFTPNHRIFITYNHEEPWWKGNRSSDMEAIRTQLVKDMIPRLLSLVKVCKYSELQQLEAYSLFTLDPSCFSS